MKILGVNEVSFSKKRYIVDISEDELANLFGFYSACCISDAKTKDDLKAGSEVQVSALYKDNEMLINIKKEFKKFESFFSNVTDFYLKVKPGISSDEE